MKKTTGVIILLVLIVGAVAVFSRPRSTGLKIGVIAPQTGNFAVLGERMKNGFEMAKSDLIKAGVIDDIEIVYEDVCQPKDAVSAVQKLIKASKITYLGGSFCLIGFVPSVPILEEAKVVYFNTAPNTDSVLGKKYFISTNSSINEKASRIGAFAYENLKGRTAAIIYYNTPLGSDFNKYLTESFEKSGGDVLTNEITLVDATDFRTQLAKVKQTNPDVLFVVQLASPLGNLLKQAKEMGVKSIIVGNSENEDPTVIATAAGAAEGFVILSDEPSPKTTKIDDFTSRYKQIYNEDADVFARNAYDALTLQVMAFNKCGNNTECALKEFHAVKNYSGVSGEISISENGSASKPTIFKVVKNGKFVQLP